MATAEDVEVPGAKVGVSGVRDVSIGNGDSGLTAEKATVLMMSDKYRIPDVGEQVSLE